MKSKVVIGLTGNIATGKSAVMALAAEQGAETIDADKVAHSVLRSALVKHDLRILFGASIFDEAGEVNRAALGKIVFADSQKMRALEGVTHPAVRLKIGRKIADSDAQVVIVEAIKLLDGPLKDHCDQIWVTACSAETQIERLITYRDSSEADARQRVSAQAPQAEKIERADVVIDTNGTLQETAAQFERAWTALDLPKAD